MRARSARNLPGALVISLDFELHWGVRDQCSPTGPYSPWLLGARSAIPRILELFREFEISATWATVGFLFADSRDEIEYHAPVLRPAYRAQGLDPYGEPMGAGEADDPLHFAPTLLEAVRATPGQEIATHTFSHYYCLEQGQSREAFRADLQSAVAIARARGLEMRSIVFPRNQHNPAYDEVLLETGIIAYRGNPRGWMYRAADAAGATSPPRRAARLLDAYLKLNGGNSYGWDSLVQPSGLCDVPASFFLRPFHPRLAAAEPMRLRRLCRAMGDAAFSGLVLHLWWHPHNFGLYTEESLRFLRRLLESFARLRETDGMRSLSMLQTAEAALGR